MVFAGGVSFVSLERCGCVGEKVRVARGVGAVEREGVEGRWWIVRVWSGGGGVVERVRVRVGRERRRG